jgi:hypothetical protein
MEGRNQPGGRRQSATEAGFAALVATDYLFGVTLGQREVLS